ncbi:MAG: hypothetical protein HDT14_06940 [Oscillibacter sp.]|nr:hypothetical protein [Oscillibacter sp.]
MKTKLYCRLTAAFCALVLLLGLSACGGGQADNPGQPGAAPQTPDAPVTTPQPEPEQPQEPMTFGQFVKADGVHIIYEFWDSNIGKDTTPKDIHVFENGRMSVQSGEIPTLGELSRMTDEEVVAEVYASQRTETDCPYFVHIKTDATGNRMEEERLDYFLSISYISDLTISMKQKPVSYTVYESQYTGYAGLNVYLTRGETFTLDDVSSGYVDVDLDSKTQIEMKAQYRPARARARLYDGTLVEMPEDGSSVIVQPLSEGRLLGAEDIQYTQLGSDLTPVAIDPSVPCDQVDGGDQVDDGIYFQLSGGFAFPKSYSDTELFLGAEGWAKIISTVGNSVPTVYMAINTSNEEIRLSDADAAVIFYVFSPTAGEPCSVSIPAGPICTPEDLWTLYGDPHGAVVQSSDSQNKIETIHYYWKGNCDGRDFFILLQDGTGYSWEYLMDCDPDHSLFEDYGLNPERALLRSIH